MNLTKLIPVGLVASAGISFFSQISANADSIFGEGQILIAGAGSKYECEKKGKRWKNVFDSVYTTADCQDWPSRKKRNKNGDGVDVGIENEECSCQS